MASSTIFRNFTHAVENKSLILIANDIASEKYKSQIEEIRSLIAKGENETAQEKKQQLLAFTPSALFNGKRLMKHLEMYSGFVHLDFDKLTIQELNNAFAIIASLPETFLCFVSPSGNGLKVFIEVDSDLEDHNEAYLQVMGYYEQKTGLKADPSCKDITRLCFMSYDPHLYKNIHNDKFHVVLPDELSKPNVASSLLAVPALKPVQEQESNDLNAAFLFQQQVRFTNQKQSYTDGNRNNYIYALSSNCNRVGMAETETLYFIT